MHAWPIFRYGQREGNMASSFLAATHAHAFCAKEMYTYDDFSTHLEALNAAMKRKISQKMPMELVGAMAKRNCGK